MYSSAHAFIDLEQRLAGVEEHVQTDDGDRPGTWEVLLFLRKSRLERPGDQLQAAICVRIGGVKNNARERGIAERRKRSDARRTTGSHSILIVPSKRANLIPKGSPWRVRDGALRRLIGKWLKAGVMEEGSVSYPDFGSPQGAGSTPTTILQTGPVNGA